MIVRARIVAGSDLQDVRRRGRPTLDISKFDECWVVRSGGFAVMVGRPRSADRTDLFLESDTERIPPTALIMGLERNSL